MEKEKKKKEFGTSGQSGWKKSTKLIKIDRERGG